MATRLVDRKDAKTITSQNSDFVKRKHFSSILWVTYGFIALIVLLAFGFKYGLTHFAQENDVAIPVNAIVISSVLVALCAYLYFVIQKMNSIVQIAEFQNMMFASATKVNSLFCFVINAEHEIIYVDDQHKNILPMTKNDSLGSFAESTKLNKDIYEKLVGAIAAREAKEMLVDIENMHGEKLKIKLTVDSLARPRDYSIVRGYKSISQ